MGVTHTRLQKRPPTRVSRGELEARLFQRTVEFVRYVDQALMDNPFYTTTMPAKDIVRMVSDIEELRRAVRGGNLHTILHYLDRVLDYANDTHIYLLGQRVDPATTPYPNEAAYNAAVAFQNERNYFFESIIEDPDFSSFIPDERQQYADLGQGVADMLDRIRDPNFVPLPQWDTSGPYNPNFRVDDDNDDAAGAAVAFGGSSSDDSSDDSESESDSEYESY